MWIEKCNVCTWWNWQGCMRWNKDKLDTEHGLILKYSIECENRPVLIPIVQFDSCVLCHTQEILYISGDAYTLRTCIKLYYSEWPRGRMDLEIGIKGNTLKLSRRKKRKKEGKKVKLIGRVWLFATPWTVAYQVPPFMGFPRQKYWSGLPFPSPRDLPDPGIEPGSPAL